MLSVACWPALRAICPPRPGVDLDIVNVCAQRNRAQRKCIAEIRRRIFARHHLRADCQAIRREDVTHLAIRVLNKSDARGAIRIVLDRDHFSGDAAFAAFEIDLAIFLLVTAADVARSQPAVVVPAAALFLARSDSLSASTS